MKLSRVKGSYRFKCYSCEGVTLVEDAEVYAPFPKGVHQARYCEHCDKLNKVPVSGEMIQEWLENQRKKPFITRLIDAFK
jgi:hypothetical protein